MWLMAATGYLLGITQSPPSQGLRENIVSHSTQESGPNLEHPLRRLISVHETRIRNNADTTKPFQCHLSPKSTI